MIIDDLDASIALVLANAVYFKGKWANEFDPKVTTDRPFHIDSTTSKQVPTMYRKGNYKYTELPEVEAKCIELPYAVIFLLQNGNFVKSEEKFSQSKILLLFTANVYFDVLLPIFMDLFLL